MKMKTIWGGAKGRAVEEEGEDGAGYGPHRRKVESLRTSDRTAKQTWKSSEPQAEPLNGDIRFTTKDTSPGTT